MLNSASPLGRSALQSAIAGQSMIRPQGARWRRTMVASLMLTSLVDAFSILVIFLIMNHGASQDVVNLGHKIVLPRAEESQFIQNGVVVRLEAGKFIVEDQDVPMPELASRLKAFNDGADAAKKEGIIIVADRNLDYESLSPVILAGSHAGFTKFKFAVIRK
ncbi:MAG: ExbD/TolR family protein [Bdellovibrionales bacterium]